MIRLFLLRLLESYFRHRWLYLVPFLLMLTVGIVAALLADTKYQTKGVVFVEDETVLASLTDISNDGFRWVSPASATSSQVNELMGTNAFIRAVIQQTDLEQYMDDGPRVVERTITEVRRSMYTRDIGNNHVEIVVAHDDPFITYQLANAAVESFVQWQINADVSQSVAAEGFFDEQIQAYEIEVIEARAQLETFYASNPSPVRGERPALEELEIQRLLSELTLAENRYNSALEKAEEAGLVATITENNVRQAFFVVDAPELPTEPETSIVDIAVSFMIFVVIGLVISGAMVLAGALLDRSMRFPIDVWHRLNLDVLATVPAIPAATIQAQPQEAPTAVADADEDEDVSYWGQGNIPEPAIPAADGD